MKRQARGPWFWILGGCGCLSVIAVIAVALLVWSGSRLVEQVVDQLEDPELRAATTRRVLGAAGAPAGYDAQLAVRIPLIGDFVVLEEPGSGDAGSDDGRVLIFVRSRMFERVAGSTSDPGGPQFEELMRQQGWRLERTDRLADGSVELESFTARWVGFRGRAGDGHHERPSLMTWIALECATPDGAGRLAAWIEPLDGDADDAPLENSVVDPAQVEALLRQIDPCPAAR